MNSFLMTFISMRVVVVACVGVGVGVGANVDVRGRTMMGRWNGKLGRKSTTTTTSTQFKFSQLHSMSFVQPAVHTVIIVP